MPSKVAYFIGRDTEIGLEESETKEIKLGTFLKYVGAKRINWLQQLLLKHGHLDQAVHRSKLQYFRGKTTDGAVIFFLVLADTRYFFAVNYGKNEDMHDLRNKAIESIRKSGKKKNVAKE